MLLRELLPRFAADELVDEFKQEGGAAALKAILEATDTYSEKHYTRADRNLKRSFYVQYVLSQMTLLEDKKLLAEKLEESTSQPKITEKKREKKSKGKMASRVKKAAKTANLFTRA